MIKVREVRIAKEVKRSDGWWRLACGDVLLCSLNLIFKGCFCAFFLSPFYLLGCGGKWINDWWSFVPFDSHCSNCQCAAPAFHDPSFGPASSSFHIADHYILPSLHHYICNITNDLDHYWSVIFISLGPIYVHGSGCKYETFLRLYCCDSGWWRYLINTNWWCQQGNPRQCDATLGSIL